MIRRAREDGELKPGESVIEVSSGNQGCGLAVVCAVLGHPLTITMPKGNSPQRAIMMRGLGANTVLSEQVDGTPGHVTHNDVDVAEALCLKLWKETGAHYPNQFINDNNPGAHERTTGPEILRQTGGRIDAFLDTVGTGGTFAGVSRYMKKVKPEVKCIVVEPQGAQAIEGCDITKPLHLLQGSGYGTVPPLFNHETLDSTISVTDEEAVEYKRLLGSKEGLYMGYTSGANVAAAVKLLKSGVLGEDPWIVTLLNDTGLKYPEIEKYDFE